MIAGLVALALVVAACAAGSVDTPPPDTTRDGTWRTTPLEDVRTGKSFTVDELRGKLVAIEPMAIWCSSCRTQQREVVAALAATDSNDLVFIGLDVDRNEEPEALAAYAQREGFDWTFVVATPDVARSLADTFGPQVLSPPSTPLLLVGPDGDVIQLHFGIRRADELAKLFRQHLP
jgi:thiol-disulfide isomerase/thioredoxin